MLSTKFDGLFSATAEMIYETDMQHGDGRNYWPFHPVFLDSLVAPFVFEELYRLMKKLESGGYSIEKMAELFGSPTKIANYQYLWPIRTLKKVSPDKRFYLAGKFVELLTLMRNGEPYCEKFRNPVWSERNVRKNLQASERYFISRKENPEMAKVLAKLEGLLVSYAETLYYYMIDLSRMSHGSYACRDKKIFVKEFFHLKAGEMWDLVADFPFDHYQEIGIYPSDMKIEVFFMGHTHANPSFPEALESFVIRVDNCPITSLPELRSCYRKTEKVVNKAVKFVAENSDNEDFLLRRGINLFFYPLKPLYEVAKESWKAVLPEVYGFAEKKKSKIRIPGPWGDWSKQKAMNFLIKQMAIKS
ncbi:MAG: hypothetical protein JSV92_01330 [archaeon]|nr:MAG: hypothetical protein JSV92_01330 [archaeon]